MSRQLKPLRKEDPLTNLTLQGEDLEDIEFPVLRGNKHWLRREPWFLNPTTTLCHDIFGP
jgi:hypothetical protein